MFFNLFLIPGHSLYSIPSMFIYNYVPFNLKHLKDGAISSLIQFFKIIQNLVKSLLLVNFSRKFHCWHYWSNKTE